MAFISLYYQFTHGSLVPFYYSFISFSFFVSVSSFKIEMCGFFGMRLAVNEANVYPFALRTEPWRFERVQKLLCANNVIQYIYYNHNNCKLHLIPRRNGKSLIFFVFCYNLCILNIENLIGNLHDHYMAIRFVHSIWSISFLFLFLKLIFYFFCIPFVFDWWECAFGSQPVESQSEVLTIIYYFVISQYDNPNDINQSISLLLFFFFFYGSICFVCLFCCVFSSKWWVIVEHSV